jgi:hypothetical protein
MARFSVMQVMVARSEERDERDDARDIVREYTAGI